MGHLLLVSQAPLQRVTLNACSWGPLKLNVVGNRVPGGADPTLSPAKVKDFKESQGAKGGVLPEHSDGAAVVWCMMGSEAQVCDEKWLC